MKIHLSFLLLFISFFSNAQAPSIVWQQTIGGSKDDSLVTIQPTKDGGFIISGHSNSDISGNKRENAYGGSFDYWIVKLNSAGTIQWSKTIGGTGDDLDPAIIQTSDGGYLVGGKSISNSSGNKTEDAINESFDYWVVKLDATGNIQWNNTIGGIQLDVCVALAQNSDGTYMLGGYSHSIGQRKNDKHTDDIGTSIWPDYWVVKLSNDGKQILWENVYGGGNKDLLTSMHPLTSGSYILGGYSYSPNEFDKTQNFLGSGSGDYWVVKIDGNGNKLWDRTIGGKFSDYETDAEPTQDGGFIMGGYSNSPASFDKSEGWLGNVDYWVVKITGTGVVQWNKTLGGIWEDHLSSVQQTSDGGYLIGGSSSSSTSATKSEARKGQSDYWIVKLDANGKELWDKTIGGSWYDRLSIIKEIGPGEYIAGGTSGSGISGDKTQATWGGNDYWIVRLSSNHYAAQKSTSTQDIKAQNDKNNLLPISLTVTPNPTNGVVTINYATGSNKNISLMIYNNKGGTIMSQSFQIQKAMYQFDLSNYASGTYYVVLSCDNNFVTRRIIKE